MKKRTQKSQKRTKFLFILIILTAILSITATYAWFSTQRDVEITGLKVKVETAENLQISLDGESWSQSIEIKDMKQLYGTTAETGVYEAVEDEHRNYIPTELLPVSTVGTLGTRLEGTAPAEGETDTRVKVPYLKFVKGEIDGKKLTNFSLCNEDDIVIAAETTTKEAANENHPYLVFDMYLRNLSNREGEVFKAEEVGETVDGITVTEDDVGKPKSTYYDLLQLDQGSKVWVEDAENAKTGLQNAVRVAFIPYAGTADLTAEGTTIRGLAADGTEKVSIWEPNHELHSQYVVTNNARGITKTTDDYVATYPIKVEAAGTNGDGKDGDGNVITIDDVNATSGDYVQSTNTIRVENDAEGATSTPEYLTIPSYTSGDETINNTLSLKPNQISKVRVYLWLEGQDPDCIDLASTGEEVSATLRLVKPENTDTNEENSYAGGETTEETENT